MPTPSARSEAVSSVHLCNYSRLVASRLALGHSSAKSSTYVDANKLSPFLPALPVHLIAAVHKCGKSSPSHHSPEVQVWRSHQFSFRNSSRSTRRHLMPVHSGRSVSQPTASGSGTGSRTPLSGRGTSCCARFLCPLSGSPRLCVDAAAQTFTDVRPMLRGAPPSVVGVLT